MQTIVSARNVEMHRQIVYFIDTEGGNLGAPINSRDNNLVVVLPRGRRDCVSQGTSLDALMVPFKAISADNDGIRRDGLNHGITCKYRGKKVV